MKMPVSSTEMKAVCQAVIESSKFVRSPRMCRLLEFLVEAAIAGDTRNTSEYAIGISVFNRNASTYYTAEDPAVRVQVGRLRDKLKDYCYTVKPAIEISIPLGSYMPCFKRTRPVQREAAKTLIFRPIACISESDAGQSFTRGLQDEMQHQLFKFLSGHSIIHQRVFSSTAKSYARVDDTDDTDGTHSEGYLLETCSRVERHRVRISAHLLDASNGHISWSEQFDRKLQHCISLQEELAQSICTALSKYLMIKNETAKTLFPIAVCEPEKPDCGASVPYTSLFANMFAVE